ncbi:hypothetical protein D3C71_1048720 [compost metagenome]
MAVVGNGHGDSGRLYKAYTVDDADRLVARAFVPFQDGDFTEAVTHLKLAILNRQGQNPLHCLDVILEHLDDTGLDGARFHRSLNDEILRRRPLRQMNRSQHLGRIGIRRKLRGHYAVLGDDRSGRNRHHDVHISQIAVQQDNVSDVARRNRADIAGDAEALSRVDRRHLEGGHRLDALSDSMTDDEIHMALIPQRLRAAVVGDEHHPAGIDAVLGMRRNRLGDIMPGRAAAHLRVHAEPYALDHILGGHALMIAGNAGCRIDRQPPVVRRPGEMAVGVFARAQRRLDLADHLLVAVDDAREVHHFAKRNHVVAPGERLGNFLGADGGAGRLKFRPCRRHAGRNLHIGRERRLPHLLQHQLNAFETKDIGNLMGIEEAASRAQRQYGAREFGHGKLCALDMTMPVEQSGSDIFSRCVDYFGMLADQMRDILADIGDASFLNADGHAVQNFSGHDIDQLAARDDQRSRQIAASRGHQSRNAISQRFSCKHHYVSLPSWIISIMLNLLVDIKRSLDRKSRRQLAALPQQRSFKTSKHPQHIILAAAEAHRADSPDLPLQRAEGARDFNAEIVQQHRADGFAVHAFRNGHTGDHRHFAIRIAVQLHLHGLKTRHQRLLMQQMPGEAGFQPFLQHKPQPLAKRIEHGSHFGMMIEAQRAPIILKHAEVKIIAPHRRHAAELRVIRPQAALHLLAGEHLRFGPLVVGNRRHAGRYRQAFLRSANDGVQLPGIRLDGHAADGRHRVDDQQSVHLAAGLSDPLQRL